MLYARNPTYTALINFIDLPSVDLYTVYTPSTNLLLSMNVYFAPLLNPKFLNNLDIIIIINLMNNRINKTEVD